MGVGVFATSVPPTGGETWSDRLGVPENWSTSREVPTMHRVVDPRDGTKRLIMWSGLYPARLAVSEDDGDECETGECGVADHDVAPVPVRA